MKMKALRDSIAMALLFLSGCMFTSTSNRAVDIDIMCHSRDPWMLTVMPYAYQDRLLPSNPADRILNVDFFVVIRNLSASSICIPSEEFSFGYDAIELDISTQDGRFHHLSKKPGVWTRNLPEIIEIPPHGEILCPISLDARIWSGMPYLCAGERISVRAHLTKWCFLSEKFSASDITSPVRALSFRKSPSSVDPDFRINRKR